MDKPFYKDGLKFKCTQCSKCCRNEPGYVFLSLKDLKRMEKKLKMSKEDIVQKYCRIITINGIKRLSLKEKSNFDCIFWNDSGCQIYKARPIQCQLYPFWSQNLYSQKAWECLKSQCPGIGKGKLYSMASIETLLKKRRKEGFITIN
jgi:Fe-S-cluster containining protein